MSFSCVLTSLKKKQKKKTKLKKTKLSKQLPILAISSLIFTTNVIAAIYKSNYLYATLFAILTVTSVAFHSKNNRTLIMAMDKIAIYSIILYGGYVCYNMNIERWKKGIIISTFLFCIGVYYYGYVEKDFCFHPDKTIGNQYHAILHLVGSIGHNMIILSS